MNLKSNFNKKKYIYSNKMSQFGKLKSWYINKQFCPLSNMLALCYNACDVDKLQKLQNRCLRMCLNINKPRDISVSRLHEIARISIWMLDETFSYSILCIV